MNIDALLVHRPFLTRLARSLVYGAEEAEDHVQEAFLAALSHPPRHDRGLRAWLAEILRNSIRMSRRSGARRAVREERAAAAGAVPDAREILVREEIRRRVVEAVVDLREIYRDVLVLRYYEDLPPREIARRLDVPLATVKTRLARGLAELRRRLDEEHDGDRKAWAVLLLPLIGNARRGVKPGLVATAAAVGLLLVGGATAISVGVLGEGETGTGPAAPGDGLVADRGAGSDAGPGAADATDPGAVGAGAGGAASTEPLTGGLVVDADGEPVPGAVLALSKEPGEWVRWRTADGRGRFPLTDLDYLVGREILAFTPGVGVSGPSRIDQDTVSLVLTLGPGGTVEGTVRDPETGKPVAGATVELAIGIGSVALVRNVDTDESGVYRFDSVPPGVHVFPRVMSTTVAASLDKEELEWAGGVTDEAMARALGDAKDVFRRDLAAVPIGGVTATFALVPPEGEVLPAAFTLEHGWDLTLHLPEDHPGSSSKDVTEGDDRRVIRMQDHEKTISITRHVRIRTAPDTTEFVWFLLRGTNRIRLRAPGIQGGPAPIEITGDGDPQRFTVKLLRKTRVVVQLVDSDGRPLERAGVEVKVFRDRGRSASSRSFRTDEKGRVDVTTAVPPPDPAQIDIVRLYFTLRGDGLFKSNERFPAFSLPIPEYLERAKRAADGRIELRVPAREYEELPVRVVLRDRRPAAGAVVHVKSDKADFLDERLVADPEGRIVLRFRNGRFGFGDVLTAEAPDRGRLELFFAGDLPGEHDDDGVLLFHVTRLLPTRIRVLDEKGRPLGGREVVVGGEAAQTGEDGVAVVPLVDGRRSPRVSAKGYVPADAKVDPDTRFAEVRLQPGRELRLVFEGFEGDDCRAIVSDAETGEWLGGFSAKADPPHTLERAYPFVPLRVRAFSANGARSADVRLPPDVRERTITLRPSTLHPLAVRFVDRSGAPIPGVEVEVDAFPGNIAAKGRTDDNGVVTLSAPAGRYRLVFQWRDVLIFDRPEETILPEQAGITVVGAALRSRSFHVRSKAGGVDRRRDDLRLAVLTPDGKRHRVSPRSTSIGENDLTITLGLPVGQWTLEAKLGEQVLTHSWDGEPDDPPPFVFE